MAATGLFMRRVVPGLAALCCVLAGCASKRPAGAGATLDLWEQRDPGRAASLASLVPWARQSGGKPASLERALGSERFEARFLVLEGAHAGKVMVQTREPGPEPGSWRLTRSIVDADEPQEQRLQQLDAATGDLVLAQQLNFERGVIVELAPFPVTVPATLTPGAALEREMSIRLPLIDNPRRLREKGTATSQMSYTADQRVSTPAGSFDARLLREVFTSRLNMATAVRTIERWLAPDAAIVAERWNEEVTVFGVVVERSRQTIVALDPDPDSPVPPLPESDGQALSSSDAAPAEESAQLPRDGANAQLDPGSE
ncbi:MAG: hypothetical protein SFZ24_00075 [Planctomycetota bacterium]|nr:hypothetical protein [Planctomycetota bacterium]